MVQINNKIHFHQTLRCIIHGIKENVGWRNVMQIGEPTNRVSGAEHNGWAHISSILCFGSRSTMIRQFAIDPTNAFRCWFLSSPLYFCSVLLLQKCKTTNNSAKKKIPEYLIYQRHFVWNYKQVPVCHKEILRVRGLSSQNRTTEWQLRESIWRLITHDMQVLRSDSLNRNRFAVLQK